MEASDGPAFNQQPDAHSPSPDLGETAQWTGCVRVRVEDSCFVAERSLLARCSDYFHALFSSGMTDSQGEELHLRVGVSAQAFLLALSVCRGQLVPAPSDPDDLMQAVECAAFLQVAPLTRYLCDIMDTDNCVLLLHAASIYGLTPLLQSSAHFLRDAYDDLREEAESNLPSDLLRYAESLSPASYVAVGTHSPSIEQLHDPFRVVCYLDEAQGEWRHLSDLPTACSTSLAGVAVLEDRLYVVGGVYGYGKGPVDAAFCYDPQTDAWSVLPGPQQPRYDFTLVGYEGSLYAVGGEVNKRTVSNAEAYDLKTGAWRSVSPAPWPVASAAWAVAHRRMFMCFWRPPDTTDIYEYQARSDAWSLVTTLVRPQSYGHCMVAHRDNLYVMRNGPHDDFLRCVMERYNLTTGQWSALPGLYVNSKGALFSAAVRGDRVFTVKHMLTLVYGVEPGGDAWTPRKQMNGFPKSGSLWTCLIRLPRRLDPEPHTHSPPQNTQHTPQRGPVRPGLNPEHHTHTPTLDRSEGLVDATL